LAATFVEISIIAGSCAGDAGIRQRDSFFRNKRISIHPLTEEQAFLASQAFSLFGKGRHPAGLNFGDCFSYALAKATGDPPSSKPKTSAKPTSYLPCYKTRPKISLALYCQTA
jgi:uncharacterized protein with PIN domain